MVLTPRLAPVGRVLPRFLTPPFARTVALSRLAREKSMRSTVRSRRRISSWSRCQTPAACQSRRRRQHVMPDPQPSSWGSHSHWMPVFNTKRMPVNAARSPILGRPPLGRGGAGGKSGWSVVQSASDTNCFAMPLVYHNTGFC
jgi:hypothetical protein